MTDRFEMPMMGELKLFLDFEIKQLSEGNFISQTKFTQDILKKFNMHEAKGKMFPMDTKFHLELNPKGVDADQNLYRSMIGSLLYLCASRPYIVLSVGVCARYQAAPKDSHMQVSIESLDIWFIPQGLGFGIPKVQTSLLLDTLTQIGLVAKMIENQLLGGRSLVICSSKK